MRSEAKQALARVSCVDGRSGETIVDDYLVQPEAVADYKTRFSGLSADDLDPSLSPHHLVAPRAAYLKLRVLADRGCVFVGHGLKTDFAVVNLFVPPSQVKETRDLFSCPLSLVR